MKKILFATCIFSVTVYCNKEDDLKKAIVTSDPVTAKNIINEKLNTTLDVIGTLKDKENDILKLAEEVRDIRTEKNELDEKKALLKKPHVQRILVGAGFMAIGITKLITDIVYKWDMEDDKEEALFSTDMLINAGFITSGGYYLINGFLKRTPRIKLSQAEEVIELIRKLFKEEHIDF